MSAVSSVIKLIPEVERAMMIKEVFSYERMKDRILCRLAGEEKCGQLSEDIVRMSYLDVSVIFCVFPEKKDCRKSAGFRISKEMLRFWDVTAEEMMRDAFRNTRNRYRYFFRDLPGVTDAISKNTAGFVKKPLSVIETVPGTSCGSRQIGAIGTFEDGGSGAFEGESGDRQCEERNIPEGGTGSAKEAQRGEPEDGNGNPERKLYGVYMSRDGSRKRDAEGEEPGDTETGELKGSSSCSCLKEEAESGMYTLVNQEFFNGAVILLFPDLLEEFARYVKADLVILPSSVEELICLIRTKNMNYGRLRGIVRTINGTCVGINEKLSDNLYLYRRGEKRIEIISEG